MATQRAETAEAKGEVKDSLYVRYRRYVRSAGVMDASGAPCRNVASRLLAYEAGQPLRARQRADDQSTRAV